MGTRGTTRRRARASVLVAAVALLLATSVTLVQAGHAGAATTIESTYRVNGPWATTTGSATDAYGGAMTLFYPSTLGANGFKHPIITWANGTWATPANYTATLTNLASWGFVVVASNSSTTGWGTEVWHAAQWAIAQNTTTGSIFNQKLDTAKVGAAGHSQGATGAVNAMILSNGAIGSVAAVEFVDPFWFGDKKQMPDWTKVNKPIFFISATGDWLVSQAQQTTYYNSVVGQAAKAAVKGGDHNIIQTANNAQLGYFTAWFRYTLQADSTARAAFVGVPPEINTNTNWINAAEKSLP